MSKQLRYIISVIIVVLAAALSASAQSISVELAEKTPPMDENGQFIIPPTTTTTTITTTTTLPAIQQCPASVDGGTAVSNSGYNYWTFEAKDLCSLWWEGPEDLSKLYCFENPYVNQQIPNPSSQPVTVTLQSLWEIYGVYMGGVYMRPSRDSPQVWTEMWQDFTSALGAAAQQHTQDCFICTCVREIGCFAPGVKITMADGTAP